MFDENNVLVKVFRYARDRLNANDLHNVKIKLLAKRISDGREYDLPAVDELAILVVDETGGVTHQPDVMVQHLSNEMERVSFYHPSLMALQYPILFPYGEDGWHPTIMLRNTNDPTNCVSQYAHINVEFCNKSRAIKYLFKYINKPPDRDEIKAFMDCRYLTAGEACWRLFKFDLYSNFPSVMRLSYHLPGQQFVYSNANSSIDQLVESEMAHTSMFLEWMKKNKSCPAARQYTYVEFPQHYTWIPKDKIWRERQKKVMIARLYYCHPSSEERFYLRMLLHVVKGCTSFEDILTVNNITYNSFKEACSAYGFLADDGEWNHCLREVSLTATSKQMRTLFVRIIMFCQVSSIGSLWGKNWHFLSDDIQSLRRKQLNIPDLQVSLEDQQNLCLLEIQKLLEVWKELIRFSRFASSNYSSLFLFH
ncbi:hypothetical protein LINPERPRIM_LOCUS22168 [Linum perenne]